MKFLYFKCRREDSSHTTMTTSCKTAYTRTLNYGVKNFHYLRNKKTTFICYLYTNLLFDHSNCY